MRPNVPGSVPLSGGPAAAAAAAVSTARRVLAAPAAGLLRLPAAAERAIELRERPQLVAARAREVQLRLEQLLVGDQDLEVAWTAPTRSASRESWEASRSATTPASCSVRTWASFWIVTSASATSR